MLLYRLDSAAPPNNRRGGARPREVEEVCTGAADGSEGDLPVASPVTQVNLRPVRECVEATLQPGG